MKDTVDDHNAAAGSHPVVSRRLIVFVALVAVYAIITLGVVFHSPLLDLDHVIKQLHLQRRFHGWYPRIEIYVMLGQRGPSTLVALPWIAYLAWRERSPRPLVLLGTALLVLNLSVGVVKLLVGRIGPLATENVHKIFDGGNIYPSGHVSNTVVLYGVLAMLATRHRTFAIYAGTFITVTVGLCTLYLNTHWFSDVLGGWLAGGLVLVSLPWLMPYTEGFAEAVLRRLQAARSRRRGVPADHPVEQPVADQPVADHPGGVAPRPAEPAVPVPVPVLAGRRPARRTISAR